MVTRTPPPNLTRLALHPLHHHPRPEAAVDRRLGLWPLLRPVKILTGIPPILHRSEIAQQVPTA